jgi:Ca2+-binding RTX toxin-like protein
MPQYPAVIALSSLGAGTGARIDGGGPYEGVGIAIASAGDMNGDGFDDVVVSSDGVSNAGAVYILFGSAPGLASGGDLTGLNGSNGFQLSGGAPSAFAGRSVAAAGDVNGDGFDDLVIGAPGSGAADRPNSGITYVVFGRASGFSPLLNLDDLSGADGFRIVGEHADDRSGSSVASAGDVNGDGFDDLLIGALQASPNDLAQAGASYLLYGRPTSFPATLDLRVLGFTDGFRISGAAALDRSGAAVASAGDVNGDGLADIFIGAEGADPNGSGSEAAYVLFGRQAGFGPGVLLAQIPLADGFRLSGGAVGDYAGATVSSAGDVNGDGFDDMIVGAPGVGRYNDGERYVVFGKGTAFAANTNLTKLDGTNGFRLTDSLGLVGALVSSAGDVNGDGFDDLIVGLARGRSTQFGYYSTSGAAFVVFGKASFSPSVDIGLLTGEDGFRLNGESNGNYTGFAVASAGDVNGDGLADILVGAPRADIGGTDTGAGYLVLGRKADAAVTRTGTEASQTLVGSDLADTLIGLGGDDRLFGHGGPDTLNGGEGNDLYVVGVGDLIVGETIDSGVDTVVVGFDYTLGRSLEMLSAASGAGPLSLTGNALANRITGGNGADFLRGGGGDDTLDGGAGADTMAGGTGRDTYVVDNRFDVIVSEAAGTQVDTVLAQVAFSLVRAANVEVLIAASDAGLALTGNALANGLTGAGGADSLSGAEGDDRMAGLGGDDFLKGGSDRDTLDGGEGADRIDGGTGADRLDGGAGRDMLVGGADADIFVVADRLHSPAGVQRDRLVDFAPGEDRIDLSGIDAVYGGGDDAFVLIGRAAFTGEAGELRWFASGALTIIAGDVDGDQLADFEVAVSGTVEFQPSDFVV